MRIYYAVFVLLISACITSSNSPSSSTQEMLQQDENYIDVFVLGDYAYVTSNWGLHIIDISNPKKMRIVGKLKTPGQAEGIYVRDGIAYIADGVGGFIIADVSNPSSPRIISRFERKGNFKRVLVEGDLAYLGDFNYIEGVVVVNVSQNEPSLVVSYDPPGYEHVRDIYKSGDIMLLADFTGGLKIINTSLLLEGINPLVADLPLRGVVYSAIILDNYAIAACSDSGVALIDISNIEKPRVLEYRRFSEYAIRVRKSNHTIFLTTGTQGVIALEIKQGKLHEIGRYNTRGNAFGIFIRGNKLYLADHNMGLVVLDISDPEHITLVGGITPGGEVY